MGTEHHRLADEAMRVRDIAAAMQALERAVAEDAGDYEGWMKLASLRRASGRTTDALRAVDAALDAQPNMFLALLLKGRLHQECNDAFKAAEVYAAAIAQAPVEETLPQPVVQQLAAARQFLAQYRTSIEASVVRSCSAMARSRARRFLENVIDRRPVFHQEPTHYRYPGLPDIEFFDDAYPQLLQRLRDAADDIRAEFLALQEAHADQMKPYVDFASGQPQGQWAPLNRSDRWRALHLLRYGEADPINAPACPRTLEAVSGSHQANVPGVGPNLMFSLLAPRTTIPPHNGVANFRVVFHLPLIVPPACAFRVGSETRPWVEGQPFVFDDTIEHEAWNHSDEMRVVLLGDLWRPELDDDDRRVVSATMAALGHAGVGTL